MKLTLQNLLSKSICCVLTYLTLSISAFGQDDLEKRTKPIVDEGKRLYKSEMASWHGTDLFLENFKEKEKLGGYISYADHDLVRCIFYSKDSLPKVIGTVSFDTTFNLQTAKIDLAERRLTPIEQDLYIIRSRALKTVYSDSLFKMYNNTSLNLIPLISEGLKKVYVLTGPKNNGVVIFGNDYLLTFDQQNNLINRKQLHKNIIVTNYVNEEQKDKENIGAMHTHLPETGDFITATDICTLMLYEKFTKWKTYNVISTNYLSIWNCERDDLVVITKEALMRIQEHQKSKNKKN